VIHTRLRLWTLLTGGLLAACVLVAIWQQAASTELPGSLLRASRGRTVTSLGFCGDASRLVLGWDDGSVWLWNSATAACVELPPHRRPVTAVAATRDGRLVATAAEDGVVRWWDPTAGSPRNERRFPNACLLCFSADGTKLACGAGNGQVEIWDVAQGAVVGRPEGHTYIIQALEFSSDDRTLIVNSPSVTQVWDVPRRQELARLDTSPFMQEAVAFCSGGRQVILVDDHETIIRCELATGRRLETVAGRRRVERAAFSPAARVLAVASWNGEIRIRDAAAPTTVATLRHLGPKATAMAFSPDGQSLAAAGADGSVRVWGLGPGVDDPRWRAMVLSRSERQSLALTVCFAVCLAGCSIGAVSDWRRGLWLCFALDLLRDPVRKLLFGHPVWVTVAAGIVWLAVGLGLLRHDRQAVVQLWRSHPRVRLAFVLTVLALLPGAVVSLVSYPSGWQFVLLGGGSYGFAWLGLVLGYCLPRSDTGVTRLLAVFCGVHVFGLLGCLPETLRWDLSVLGGIDTVWYRSFTTGWMLLVSGLYRSPDVLGWHAAQVLMFGTILLTRPAAATNLRACAHGRRGWARGLWLGTILVSVLALLLAGRRKMTVMPLVFLATWLIGLLRGGKRLAVLLALPAVILAAWLPLQALQRSRQAPDLLKYLAWTTDDSIGRVAASVQGACETWRTAGVLGHGLGTATQGRYHFRATGPRLWQEDGLGRVVAEAGAYGTLLLLGTLFCLGQALRTAIARSEATSRSLRLSLFGVVLANFACYAVSHQVYSGDPTLAATVGLCLGLALAPLPGVARLTR